jgi:hypothetical protein
MITVHNGPVTIRQQAAGVPSPGRSPGLEFARWGPGLGGAMVRRHEHFAEATW